MRTSLRSPGSVNVPSSIRLALVLCATAAIGCAIKPQPPPDAITSADGGSAPDPKTPLDRPVTEAICDSDHEWSYVERRCVAPRPGERPGDACGANNASGESSTSSPACAGRRGLRCVSPRRPGSSAQPVCACAPGQRWSTSERRCALDRLGEHPGDVCGPGGEGTLEYAPCDAERGLLCASPPPEEVDAPPTCACANGAWNAWAQRCLATPDGGCGR